MAQETIRGVLDELGIRDPCLGADGVDPTGPELVSVSPVDGSVIARVRTASLEDYEAVLDRSGAAFRRWRALPAPRRGEVVRQMGEEFRRLKRPLGRLVSWEMGKIAAEGEGEVQEAIDVCDFAVGLSRQLYGLAMHSERPGHRMYEQWHPLGVVGVITAFNFPVAVWAWNAALALVCGDVCLWKPSSKTPLSAVACQAIARRVLARHGLEGVTGLVVGGGASVGERLIEDPRIPLVSATGSCRMGRHVAQVVGRRLGRTILELGGNNAIVVMADADLELATRAILFGAVGTAGQRCTSTRRLLLERPIADEVLGRLRRAYAQVRIGNPLDEGVLMGPLVDTAAVRAYHAALVAVREQGGEVIQGGRALSGSRYPGGCYVEPTLVRARPEMPIVREETFAPILYCMEFDSLDQALEIHNGVAQGLSSAIFSTSLRSAERFLSAEGSDCGIANVNIGTSGAEVGGAFGGEKDTGGGRESGSDAWKAYMRRQTCTINYSAELPLAQGIRFGE
ncbi:MAG: aldehyde dehydrogenase family protein [Planctomycetes bacterium]|nr:aldehyde dehydrogenase family protein [Planctomycetota bacterium]